jgi:hypothetical protein
MQNSGYDLWDKIWKNKNGDVVIWQMPNVFLIAWVIFTIISIVTVGQVSNVFLWLGDATLVIWALLELVKGANYFRRFMGLVVLGLSVLLILKSV